MTRTSAGIIEVLQPGFGITVQDRGRPGHRHEGIPLSGWLDAPLAEAANALAGNNGGEAVLELRGMSGAAVADAGGLGSIGCGMMEPEAICSA